MTLIMTIILDIVVTIVSIYLLIGLAFTALMLNVNHVRKLGNPVNAEVIVQLVLFWLPMIVEAAADAIKDATTGNNKD